MCLNPKCGRLGYSRFRDDFDKIVPPKSALMLGAFAFNFTTLQTVLSKRMICRCVQHHVLAVTCWSTAIRCSLERGAIC